MWIPKLFKKQVPGETKDAFYLYKDKDTGLIGYLNPRKIFENLAGLSVNIVNALNGSSNASEDNVFATEEDLIGLNGSVEIYVNAATTVQLENCIYNNGTDGIGATLIKVGNGAFPTIDGVPTNPNNTYLIKNQVNVFENGVYELTTVGSGGASWVLTRIALFDEPSEIYPATVTVLGGASNGNTLFFQKTKTVTDIGTSNIIFQRINSGTVPIYEPTTVSVYLVDIATLVALPACTYANGAIDPIRPGIGATLTANANGVFPTLNGIDPTTYTSNSLKILVQNQVDDEHNGIYRLVNVGTASSPWMLVRSLMVSSHTIAKKVTCVSNSDSSEYGKFFACDNIEIANTAVGTDSVTFTEISGGGGDNFANANLTFTANRTHDLDGYRSTFKDAEIQITSEANTASDIPLQVFQMDTSPGVRGASILKVQGDGTTIFTNTNTDSIQIGTNGTGKSIQIIKSGTGDAMYLYTQQTGVRVNSFGDGYCFYGEGNSNNYALRLDGKFGALLKCDGNSSGSPLFINNIAGTKNVIRVTGDEFIMMETLKDSPSYVDDAAAAAGGVPVSGLYRNGNAIQIRLV